MRRPIACLAVVATVLAAGAVAQAAPRLPKPGSAAQVATLVAKSGSITKLPANLLPALSGVAKDTPGAYFTVAGHGCATVTKCVFANKQSPRTVVLFGDSHAWMWMPAIFAVAQRAHVRLVLVWRPGCPAATISVWDAPNHSIAKGCDTFRASMIAAIHKLSPKLVLLSDRTSDIPGALGVMTTNAAWQAGLEQTIAALKSSKTTVAVIGDVTAFTAPLPACLAAYPTAVQTCSAPNPNTKTHQHFAAEMAAATAESAPYVNPQSWLCTKTCSPVIGNMVAYSDNLHVTATYAEYLTNLFATALKGLLGP